MYVFQCTSNQIYTGHLKALVHISLKDKLTQGVRLIKLIVTSTGRAIEAHIGLKPVDYE